MTEEENLIDSQVLDSDEESPAETEDQETSIDSEKLSTCEDKLQRVLADYQNLERRSKIEISQKVTRKINQIMLDFIVIYEDFIRAKSSLKSEDVNTQGLDGVIKNMENLLSENNVKPIEAVGEIFDPRLHEAVSTIEDNSLDDGTITQEVAKGYISFEDVLRPSKVIVSKKNQKEQMKNEWKNYRNWSGNK